MDELLLTNVFFMITAAAVIIVTGVIVVLAIKVLPIIRDVRDIVSRLQKAGRELEQDFGALRENLHKEAGRGKAIVDAGLSLVGRKLGVKNRSKK